ncbi:hypothetical protein [Leptospirillum ferriphilum]|uniref:Uncharacterized protein n=1 Tax=Leptospirillum ferriphilum TaxID=178606 RepID=A0A1V3SX10_9BACT|nr:hypothetical protein [Leptospirillum ferriphilum]OOH73596.1 hypothetical protein BOX24_03720 [Leptospirillum ferriphilum]
MFKANSFLVFIGGVGTAFCFRSGDRTLDRGCHSTPEHQSGAPSEEGLANGEGRKCRFAG